MIHFKSHLVDKLVCIEKATSKLHEKSGYKTIFVIISKTVSSSSSFSNNRYP